MSLYEKATLVQIPSGYKASSAKLYSVIPSSGDGDFTISSDTDATRINAEGLIEDTAANQARLNYDFANPQDPHLLLEPTRTNNVSKSFYEAGSPFNLGANISFVENVTSPDGSNNGARFVSNSTGNSFIQIQSVTIPSGDFTFSMYIKGVEGSFIDKPLQVFGLSDVYMNETPIAGEDWKRVYGTGNNSGSSFSTTIVLPFFDQPVNTKFDIFGFQLEAGTYASSYIPTSGSAVTRTQGEFENSFTGLTSTAATIFLDFETKGLDYNFGRLFAVHDSVTSDGIYLGIYSTNTIGFFGIDGGAGLPDVKDTISFNERNKLVLAFDGSGNYKYSLNGSLKTGTYTGTSRQYDEVGRGNVIGGSSNNIQIHQLMIFNEALSDSEIQTLTS